MKNCTGPSEADPSFKSVGISLNTMLYKPVGNFDRYMSNFWACPRYAQKNRLNAPFILTCADQEFSRFLLLHAWNIELKICYLVYSVVHVRKTLFGEKTLLVQTNLSFIPALWYSLQKKIFASFKTDVKQFRLNLVTCRAENTCLIWKRVICRIHRPGQELTRRRMSVFVRPSTTLKWKQ